MSTKRINHFYGFVDRLTDPSGLLRNIYDNKSFNKNDLHPNSAEK